MSALRKNKIDELIDKAEITDVVNSYFRALDQKHFEAQYFATIFTAEAIVIRPNGSPRVGPEEISASHARSVERFESSQHLAAGYDISVSDSRATARANLVAMHMWQGSNTNANHADNFFIAGGVIDVTLVRADGQWKISQISNNVAWRAGGFKDMLQTGR
jgi:hypothetical protein